MPTSSGYAKAPKACQVEWGCMWQKLKHHGEGYRDIFLETLSTTEEDLEDPLDL